MMSIHRDMTSRRTLPPPIKTEFISWYHKRLTCRRAWSSKPHTRSFDCIQFAYFKVPNTGMSSRRSSNCSDTNIRLSSRRSSNCSDISVTNVATVHSRGDNDYAYSEEEHDVIMNNRRHSSIDDIHFAGFSTFGGISSVENVRNVTQPKSHLYQY